MKKARILAAMVSVFAAAPCIGPLCEPEMPEKLFKD